MALRVLEVYPSIQGEGPRTGQPTIFVRFAGCNLRCPGWPCDTPFAIEPKLYREEQRLTNANVLVRNVREMAEDVGVHNICLTGGEPLLQHREDLHHFIAGLTWLSYQCEMFSNGTISYSATVTEGCAIRLDWKLPGSEEDSYDKTRTDNVKRIIHGGDRQDHTIKFTIKDETDLSAALEIYAAFLKDKWKGSIYAGPVWESDFTARDIADAILVNRLPWMLNIQSHNYIYGAHTRRT